MENIVTIQNVSFNYKRMDESEYVIKALENVDLNIEKGSFTAIIGVNGSGKSTLAKHMNGLILPDEGTVIVDGMVTGADDLIWKIRQTVGMVFQNPDNQMVSAVVEDDVAFGPENLGVEP